MIEGPTTGIVWLPRKSHNAAVSRFSAEKQSAMDAEEQRLFSQPDRRAILWRYMETYKFQDMLETASLYLCQVSKLAKDDPNEGVMNRSQLEALRAYLPADETQFQNFVNFHERIRQRAWVTCFSLGDFEEPHMWQRSCKGDTNQGVVVRTTYQKLSLATLGLSKADEPKIAMVRYEQNGYMPWKIGYLLYQKLPSFSDEREVRVCLCKPELDIAAPECTRGYIRVHVRLARLVQYIYVHPHAPESYFREIQRLVATHLPNRQGRVQWSRLHSPSGQT